MRGWFRGAPPPVRRDEIPALAKARIAALNLPSWVEVYSEQEFPSKTGETSPPWGRISVWLRREEMRRTAEPSPDGQEVVRFGVNVEVAWDPELAGGWDYLRSIADLHDLVFTAVNGHRFGAQMREETLRGHVYVTEDVLPSFVVGMLTEAPVRDDSNNTWMQMCEYSCVLVRRPKEA